MQYSQQGACPNNSGRYPNPQQYPANWQLILVILKEAEMKNGIKLLLVFFLITSSISFAQGKIANSQRAGSASSIVGLWQASVSPQPGSPPILVRDIFTPDGKWREEIITDGQVTGFWEGNYTLTPDGKLTTNETNVSPQVCIAGQCKANNPPTTTVSRVKFQGTNSFLQEVVDPSTGQVVFSVTHERMNDKSQGGQPSGPANPVSGCSNPLDPKCSSQNTANNNTSWSGAYTDGQLKLVLQEQANVVNGLLELAGNQYQLQAQGDANNLQGIFKTPDGQQFELSISRANGGVVLSTGGKSYNLQMVQLNSPGGNPVAPAPTNPLGN